MTKELLKKLWHYKPFWKWYCRVVIAITILLWITFIILEQMGIIIMTIKIPEGLLNN